MTSAPLPVVIVRTSVFATEAPVAATALADPLSLSWMETPEWMLL
jgi:hypothetical protein